MKIIQQTQILVSISHIAEPFTPQHQKTWNFRNYKKASHFFTFQNDCAVAGAHTLSI